MKLYGIRTCLIRDNETKILHMVHVKGYMGIGYLGDAFKNEGFAVLKIWSKKKSNADVINFLMNKRTWWTKQRQLFFVQLMHGIEGNVIEESEIEGRKWLDEVGRIYY